MSGGSYSYAHLRVEEFASELRARTDHASRDRPGYAERLAFAAHLDKVATAMHAIEWVDSCDWAKGTEVPSITQCMSPEAIEDAAFTQLRQVLDVVRHLLDERGVGQTDRGQG